MGKLSIVQHLRYCTCSRGILFAATSLVNQAVMYERDEPQTGYCVSTDGKLLRFQVSVAPLSRCFYVLVVHSLTMTSYMYQAFQLNTLNFDASDEQAGSRRNASWVYETELFHESASNPEVPLVNPEAIEILSSILSK